MTEAEILLIEGSGCNNFLLYEDAIKCLSKAIKLSPKNIEVYQERSFSFFELNLIEKALEDYKKTIELPFPYRIPKIRIDCYSQLFSEKNSSILEFSKGLIYGNLLGSREGTIEFLSSIRGGLSFLWSFACSPYDVSKELVEALINIGDLIASGKVFYLQEHSLPELTECAQYWHSWSDYTKGQKLGFIIGKYSISAFFYITSFNYGVHFFNSIKRANVSLILERFSKTKNLQILEKGASNAAKQRILLQKAASGHVVAHNPNVLSHIFVEKHRWDKYIRISGNKEKDFQSLVSYLEKNGVFNWEKEIKGPFFNVELHTYSTHIGKDKIVAVFDVNSENIHLLKNAWVEMNAK